jgi:DNA-binding LacI/PurR family transcriptional regulator
MARVVTLADVARSAGVSISTASRALNGIGELSDETRAAVAAAALELKFQPSPIGRSLRTQRTKTVGFVVPDNSTPFFAACLKGAARLLGASGYRVIAMDSDRSVEGEIEALQTLLWHRVDGLLLSTTGLTAGEFEEVTSGWPTPCVFFDGVLADSGAGSITLDNVGGMAVLVGHLVEHGHRRIAHVGGPQNESSAVERSAGFKSAAKEAGMPASDTLEVFSDWDRESARRAAHALLSEAEPPTAVVASSDDIALGCLRAFRERSMSVPRDMAIVSFDDPYYGELLEPPLTALKGDPTEIGSRAGDLLLDAIQDGNGSGTDEGRDPVCVRLPVELQPRRSCGCT